jgi:TolB-like protein/Flp pilus assembly protein TadD
MEYLSDGIAEALINSLTEVQQLRVIARSTAFRYKGTDIDPRTVGRDLNVRAVLMGRVRQMGDALNVQVDLVDASTGAQLWGVAYDRKISDTLAVKQDIAREITEKLRLRLTGDEQKQLVKRDTKNAEAYELYLKGRYDWTKRTAHSLKRAIELFQQAVDKDPNYALAYVGLADCYLLLTEYADAPASETVALAKAFDQHALEIDASLAEARTSLAYAHMNLWEWAEAEREFKRAISLNPNYPTAHQWYNLYLRSMGRFDEAMVEIRRAQELDPLSPIINSNLAALYLMKRDANSAIEQCQKTIEIDPNFSIPHDLLGSAYLRQGRYAESISELGKAVELSGRGARQLASLGYCYAISARRTEAVAVLKELEENFSKRAAGAGYIAEVYAGLGEKEQAFAWLERGVRARGILLVDLRWNVRFDPLRNDPRYADLVRRMGLTP